MKIDDRTVFPWPVLREGSEDYRTGSFRSALTAVEVPSGDNVIFEYSLEVSAPPLEGLIAAGIGAAGVFIRCADTCLARLVALSLPVGTFSIPRTELMGRVMVRPMVWTTREVRNFHIMGCHEEFGSGEFVLPQGAILAWNDEVQINVDPEKLRQIETIFTLAKSDSLDPETFDLDLETDHIRILVAPGIYETVNRLRKLQTSRPVVLNSVFLPAVMEVLDQLRGDEGTHEGKRWYRVFRAKCDHLGIDPADPELWKDAQSLLETPFETIELLKESILG